MASPLEELEAAALALPREDRARLARNLIESLDEADEVEEAWRKEVRHRLDAYRQGQEQTSSLDEVLDRARESTER